MTVRIYHNPRCSKSRQTLELLRKNGIEPEIIEYLKTPPSASELDGLLGKLGMEPRDLDVRLRGVGADDIRAQPRHRLA